MGTSEFYTNEKPKLAIFSANAKLTAKNERLCQIWTISVSLA